MEGRSRHCWIGPGNHLDEKKEIQKYRRKEPPLLGRDKQPSGKKKGATVVLK